MQLSVLCAGNFGEKMSCNLCMLHFSGLKCQKWLWRTLPETNSSHLEMDGRNTMVSFWGPAYFQGRLLFVSGSFSPFFFLHRAPCSTSAIWARDVSRHREMCRGPIGLGREMFTNFGSLVLLPQNDIQWYAVKGTSTVYPFIYWI